VKPPSDERAKERSGDRERSGEKPAGVASPHTEKVPAEPPRERDHVTERPSNEQTGASKAPVDERTKEHTAGRPNEKTSEEKPRSGEAPSRPGHEQAKAKPAPKPTPKPTPTPAPKNN
jgi:hypothetical protein